MADLDALLADLGQSSKPPPKKTQDATSLDDLMADLQGSSSKPRESKTEKPVDDLDALMADLGGGPPAKKEEKKSTANDDLDSLMADLQGGGAQSQPAKAEPKAEAKPAAKAADDLDNLMADLQGGGSKPAPKEKPPPKSTDDLDDLMADLQGGASKQQPAAAAQKEDPKPAEKKTSGGADDLDALMADLQGGGAKPASKKEAEPARQSQANDLDALMADLSGGSKKEEPAPKTQTAPASAGGASGGADDLDALMNDLKGGGSGGQAQPRSSVASTGGGGGAADLDSLMADLAGSSKPAAKAEPAAGGNDLDALMASLQSPGSRQSSHNPSDLDSVFASLNAANAPPPQQQGGGASSLDNILSGLTSDMNRMDVNNEYKGTCAGCNKPIVGQVVTALGKSWHVEHFACGRCHVPLGTASFFENQGVPYCEKCYHAEFSPRCAYCNGPIMDQCINALGKMWHPDHFFCAHCGKSFQHCGFMEKDGKAYCEEDYFAMFAPKCGRTDCGKNIMGECITALDKTWHKECFNCCKCSKDFGGKSFFPMDGQPMCEMCWHESKGSLCGGCKKPVVGRCVTAMGKKFHPEHFICAFCMKQLSKGSFKEQNEKAYCLQCHVKLYG